MTILSLPAIGRIAERHLRQHGEPMPRDELVKWLASIDVTKERADAGIRLAITLGRLIDTPSGLAIPTFDEGTAA